MKLRAQGFSHNKRQGLTGTIVVLNDDDQPTGVEHFGNYSRNAAKELSKKLQDVGLEPEDVMPRLTELLKELRSAADAAASPTDPADTQPDFPYITTEKGLALLKDSVMGVVPVMLTNFTARIVAEQLRNDGAETQRIFEIEATLKGRTSHFLVSALQFAGMAWVAEHLGAQAVISPGFALKDHARAAVQLLSGQVPTQQVFTHTGWRQFNRTWTFLHGGGAICPTGQLGDVTVDLPESLRRFQLPEPPTGDDLRSAVKSSLEFLDVAGDPVTVPLYCAIWRAVLGGADFTPHLVGATGAGKSELAALAQQHFGAGMDSHHLPASWSSTPNALEGLTFSAKDVLLVVDDFSPTGSVFDVQRTHREADRLLRAQGNLSARLRMRSDSSLRIPKPPRGLILSTSEDTPRGQSLRARLIAFEIPHYGAGSLNWANLTVCQRYAATGQFAQAMSGFLRWLAPQYREVQARLPQEMAVLASIVRSTRQHQRTPYNVANLALGLDYFLRFAAEVGALSVQEVDTLSQRTWQALGTVAAAQGDHQADSEPTGRFLQLLSTSIASGQAHVAAPSGSKPSSPQSWGWRKVEVGTGGYRPEEWQPQGRRIGWANGEDLYLEAEAAYAQAQRMASDGGEALTITLPTLRKRLKERGLLASTQEYAQKERLEVRRTLEGNRRSVLHLHSSALVLREVRQVHHGTSHAPKTASESGPYPGALPSDYGAEVCQESEPQPIADVPESRDEGALGALSNGMTPEPPRFITAQTSDRNEPWEDFLREVEQQ